MPWSVRCRRKSCSMRSVRLPECACISADCQRVCGPPSFPACNPKAIAPGPADQFLQRFGKPERLLSCDCERSDDVTLSQAFQLITGETVNKAANLAGIRLSDLLHEGRSATSLVDDCYLAALCRYPTARERAATESILHARANPRGLRGSVGGAAVVEGVLVEALRNG